MRIFLSLVIFVIILITFIALFYDEDEKIEKTATTLVTLEMITVSNTESN